MTKNFKYDISTTNCEDKGYESYKILDEEIEDEILDSEGLSELIFEIIHNN